MAAEKNDTETTRKARRDWIDAQGNPVASGDESKAVGFRYTHIPSAKRIDPKFDPETDAPSVDAVFELTTMSEPTKTMLAIFGGLTLVGNIVSTATNPKSKGDPDANPIPDVVARFEEIANGTWTGERGAGGVRFDKAKLAEAIAKAKGETDPNPYLAKLESGEKIKQKGKAEISYGAYAMKNPEVQKHYALLTNADVVTLNDL
jgi:hypothetical protein